MNTDEGRGAVAAYIGLVEGFAALAANRVLLCADPHDTASIRLLRKRASSLCIDEDCDLSGYFEHMGECSPCSCPHRHAIEECPEDRE